MTNQEIIKTIRAASRRRDPHLLIAPWKFHGNNSIWLCDPSPSCQPRGGSLRMALSAAEKSFIFPVSWGRDKFLTVMKVFMMSCPEYDSPYVFSCEGSWTSV